MKKLVIIFFIIISSNLIAQKTEAYNSYIKELKKDSKIDKNDKTVSNLLYSFYDEMLQSDSGGIKPETLKKITDFYANKDSKNKQILNMFIAYQNNISDAVANGSIPDSKFQLELINDLQEEIKNTYSDIPIIVLIYKIEALNADNQLKESANLIESSLKSFPNSIPLKVYKYLSSKDEKIKNDLVKNHSEHWMVQQFGIK